MNDHQKKEVFRWCGMGFGLAIAIDTTVYENKIGVPKIRKKYGTIKLLIFQYCNNLLRSLYNV